MRSTFNPLPVPPDPDDSQSKREQRRRGRLNTERLTCKMGDIVDLSASGLRVRCKGKPKVQTGDLLDLDLKSLSWVVPIEAKVVWSKHTGFRQYEVGLELQNISEETNRDLLELIRESKSLESLTAYLSK